MVAEPLKRVLPSPRVRLARVALETALATKQVAAGTPGRHSQWATADAGEQLSGVLATVRPDGRYDVELCLVARWPVPPLHELGEQIRTRVQCALEREGLGDSLGDLGVAFGDLLAPDEPAVE